MNLVDFLSHAEFILGAPSLSALPPDDGYEVAFAGRSNSGKSSAINTITGRKGLARTSATPGRTQEINFFVLPGEGSLLRLVDLPGYGYARASKEVRMRWQRTMHRYLETRHSLCGLILLMDCRHPLTEGDQHLLSWCLQADMPVHVLLTKIDKLKRGAAKAAVLKVDRALKSQWPNATVQPFSSLKRQGLDTARRQLALWLNIEPDNKKSPGH